MIHKLSNLALIIALTVTVAFAQQPSSSTPSVDRLRQVIAYLASDALEGRRTGTPGGTTPRITLPESSTVMGCGQVCK